VVGAPPLPVLNMSVPGPSEVSPAPDCQMPAPLLLGTVIQRALTWAAVETPKIHPCHGEMSQWEPNAA
jgi:hypothetical protein